MMDRPIGFIGLGNMGGPMAGNLASKGRPVICHDAGGTQGKAHPEAAIAASNREVAERCEMVICSLPDGPIVHRVLEEVIAAHGRRTTLFVDTSTIGIEWARRNAELAAQAGIEYIDAPVSGGASGARAGTIAVMCSGRRETIDRITPILLDFCGHVFHVGEQPGQAQAMKVLNNFLSATAMAATSEAIAFGVREGLDMKTMLDVINVSSGQNTATADKFPKRVLTGRYDAGFRVGQLAKDLALYAEAADAADAERPVSPTVIALWSQLLEHDPQLDITKIYPLVSGQPVDD